MPDPCQQHSGIVSRLDRAEQDIQTLFGAREEKNKAGSSFIASVVLLGISMLMNGIMFFIQKGGN